MNIKNLKLINFRNYKTKSLSFGDKTNLIIGANGTGKTNILEAINLLSTGSSFKARYDYEMIFNPHVASNKNVDGVLNDAIGYKEFARVMGDICDGKNEETLEAVITKKGAYSRVSQKTYKVNGTAKPLHESLTYLTTVLFCPQDLDLLNGSPSARREFLDDLLRKTDQKYKKELSIYTKAVRQRNRILEKINKFGIGAGELDFWTEKILESGTYLQEKRSELIAVLNSQIESVFRDLSAHRSNIVIDYKINQITPARLEKHREHEIFAKTTLVGPHRDDFEFLMNGFNIGHYGSRGQQRTGVLALKICELGVVKQKSSPPILLLDDIFSELDDGHKESLRDVIQSQQTIISSTHSDIEVDNIISL